MNHLKQIIEIAELDGWKQDAECGWRRHVEPGMSALRNTHHFQYLDSRDAIVPVIEKQSRVIQTHVGVILQELIAHDLGIHPELVLLIDLVKATPSQLSEALLRATGKWVKE